ncbi:MAG: IS66 family transposase [Acidobacteriia bacterium]|nr:IS66 family transposase [Terriglobia bacterium]
MRAADAEARRKELSVAARHVRRQERATPLLDEIRGRIDAAKSIALPSSALSKACQYALTLWRKLTRFLEYPELELSNNLAENSMRPVALGRNYAQLSIMRSAVGVCLDRGTVSAIGHFRGTRTAHN